MEPAKRVLTIDGGGIRGVFAAAIVEAMEQRTGKPSRELFDCFYGTSTGAILAAALAFGIPAAALVRLYREQGTDIFSKTPVSRIVERWLYWTYSKEPLEQELKQMFGEARLSEIPTPLAIVAKDTRTGTPAFFNNFPGAELDLPLWQAVRASTAAPTFFAPELDRYVDGGISAYNNPTYAAFIGVSQYLRWPVGAERLRFYSVGTGYHPPRIVEGTLEEQNKLQMVGYVVEDLMDDINLLQNQLMSRLMRQRLCWYKRYTIRFEAESFARLGIPVEGVDFEGLSQMDGVEYLEALAAIGAEVGARLVHLEDFQ